MSNTTEAEDGRKYLPSPKLVCLSYRLDHDLHNRINKQVNLLKYIEDPSFTKQRWILEAIKEQLEREEELSPEELGRESHISFRIDERLSQKIEERVKINRKFRNSFSKKQWLIEAFYEKLLRDEKEVKKTDT